MFLNPFLKEIFNKMDYNDNVNKEEIDKNDKIFLTNYSTLFKEDKKDKIENEEIFQTKIFSKMVKDHKNLMKQKREKEKQLQLRNLMKCGCCKKNLQDLFLCPFCKNHSCKKCFNKKFYYLKRDHTPCPLCGKKVKRSMLRSVTLINKIAEVVEEDTDNVKESIMKFNPNELISKCDIHIFNKIFVYCIDCDKKMCPVCFDIEQNKHKEHRCVNYEKYLELNLFFGNSFKNMKNFILISEKAIIDLQKLNYDLENKKSALLNFANDLSDKINILFNEELEKINEIISSLTQKISDYNNFRKDIKKSVTKKIPKGYSEFDDMETIKKEITKKVGELKIELPNKVFENLEKKYKKKINFSKIEEKININKERIMSGININVQDNENYKFNIEVSADKEEIYFYLNINNYINEKENLNSYLVKIEVYDLNNNAKTICLEMDKDKENKNNITFSNSILRKELFNYYKNGFIFLKIFYLDI